MNFLKKWVNVKVKESDSEQNPLIVVEKSMMADPSAVDMTLKNNLGKPSNMYDFIS